MSKIFILGDNHGRFNKIVQTVIAERPDAVISVGDIMGDRDIRPLEQELMQILSLTEFWWIPGNHDTDSDAAYDGLFGSALAECNFSGRVVTIAGLRVAGLGGVFRGKVWMPPADAVYESENDFLRHSGKGNRWRGGLPRPHHSTIFPDTYHRLVRERADLLITHEAPSCHPHGFAEIDELARALRVKAAFHGHHHDCLDYSQVWDELGFQAFGVGLRGITDSHGTVIVPGELDAQRRCRQPQSNPS